QFFYEDDKPDVEYFRAQAREFGFDEAEYLEALSRVKVCSREKIRNIMEYHRSLVQVMAETGLRNLELSREVATRERIEKELKELNEDLEQRVAIRTLQLLEANELLQKEIARSEQTIDELRLTQFCVDKASIGIYRITEKGNIAYANELACSNLGYSSDELCSMTLFDIDPTFNIEVFEEHRSITRTSGYRIFESIHRRKDGSTFPVEITVNYLEYEDKGFSVSFATDISNRKQAEAAIQESRAKYQAIVDAFDGLIYTCSQDYRIEFMNRKLIERTGYDATGEPCYKIVHDRDARCPWCVNDRVFAGETVRWEMFSPRDNRWYYVVNVPIRHADGSMSKHSMIIDINDRKLAEERLQQQKDQLEELNRTLEERVHEEVAKNREKDIILIQQNRQAALGETLEHIAHQWKQPLNTIGLLVQQLNLAVSVGGLTEEAVDETVAKTMDLLTHMAQTIDVFRDFYKPEKKKTVFRLQESIDRALSFIGTSFRHHNISTELDVDPQLMVNGYPKEFIQVLLIILTNARDVFGERNTAQPRLVIRTFTEGNRTVVTVADNAGGIPENIIGNVFDLYFTTKKADGGSGIGLYMAKSIIEKRMKGTLSVTNTEQGAQFRIEIDSA
ncbi:MAG TPA: PAS domain S-box protein, partial [Geobacteraceae bacterium]|nr:PAS domain S-box protein [Geobacteraceae bacterium]